jgi:hypothetical protein
MVQGSWFKVQGSPACRAEKIRLQHVSAPSAFASSDTSIVRTLATADSRAFVRGYAAAQITTFPTLTTFAASGSDGSTSTIS